MTVSPPLQSDLSSIVDLSIVVPVYKEAGNIKPFLQRTEAVMVEEINRNPAIKLILFSRRFGQPAATMAGILNCTGQRCVVIDVDLQDPPELIAQLYDKLAEGYEVVYAMRTSREGETLIK